MTDGGDRAEVEHEMAFEAAREMIAGTTTTTVFFLLHY